jgi:hypothetical protein
VVACCWISGFVALERPVAKVPGTGSDDNIVILKGLCSPVKSRTGDLLESMRPVQFKRSAPEVGCANRIGGRLRRPRLSAAFAGS